MENIYINDEFYGELDDFIEFLEEEQDIEDLDDDYSVIAFETELRPIVTFTPDWITDRIDDEEFSENGQDMEIEKIQKALSECVDFKRLNSMIPKLHYPFGNRIIITKADLLAAKNS